MKQPEAGDFEVKVLTGGVQVNFKPTFSYYWYDRLIEPHDIKRFGPISPSARIRHMGWRAEYRGLTQRMTLHSWRIGLHLQRRSKPTNRDQQSRISHAYSAGER